MQNQKEVAKKEILLMGNGSRIEVSHWTIDKKYLYGNIVSEHSNISVFIPASYLASNIVKSTKKRRG